MELIAKRHHGPSAEVIQLTKLLLGMYDDMLPGKVFNGLIPSFIRNLAGDQISDWMEVPKRSWDSEIKYKIFRAILKSSYSGILSKNIHRFGLPILNLQVESMTESSFKIPGELHNTRSFKKIM